MKLFALILLLLGILMAVGMIRAQEQEILVSYSTNEVSELTPHYARSFLERVENRLSILGITMTIIRHIDSGDIPENAIVDIHFYELPPIQRRQKLSEQALLKSFRTEIA
jgi:hypothetical protein